MGRHRDSPRVGSEVNSEIGHVLKSPSAHRISEPRFSCISLVFGGPISPFLYVSFQNFSAVFRFMLLLGLIPATLLPMSALSKRSPSIDSPIKGSASSGGRGRLTAEMLQLHCKATGNHKQAKESNPHKQSSRVPK